VACQSYSDTEGTKEVGGRLGVEDWIAGGPRFEDDHAVHVEMVECFLGDDE
jgi:hypothetical protein